MAGASRPAILKPLLIAVAVVGALAIAFLAWRAWRPGPLVEAGPPQSFSVDNVVVDSPDLAVGPATVRGTIHEGYTDWACILECREPAGCNAEIQLIVDFTRAGENQQLVLAGAVAAATGEVIRLDRVEWRQVSADRVGRVRLVVVGRRSREGTSDIFVD